MLKIIFSFILLITFSSISKANNFKESIEIYGKKNSGTTSLIYIFNRCAGITGYVHSMLEKEPNSKESSAIYLRVSTEMTNRASTLYSKHSKVDLNNAMNENLKRTVSMMKLYQEDAKENFIKTGSYLTGIVKQDMDYCVKIEKEFQK
jgi:arsenate reductase-like glutaredoxin family protein